MSEDGHATPTASTAPPVPGRETGGGRAGETIGPYRLLSLIGEGGFGEVWLAEQREPIARRVALKLIKPGMDSRAVIARFEQERRALALMDHPNIAKVHDAGTTPAGRLFFVMEHVKGAPITDYCDKARLTIRQRLELFSKVCDAVQHAHMKGIIHRDLKPSNILVAVGEADSAGGSGGGAGRAGSGDAASAARPVVIDFGVAKAVAARLTEKTIYTEQGQLIGTPEYMSPEQAEMAETDIDTRTDIYALGVILYELLTGALPFDPNTLRAAGYAAIQKIIREVDPPKPSTRLGALRNQPGASATGRDDQASSAVEGSTCAAGGSATPGAPTPPVRSTRADSIAHARRTTLHDLAGQLRRELDWIPLKALRKERTERYRTASELSDDIANYLADRPLIAGPESAAYRARKFVRRNRAGVLAGAAVFVSLILGLAGTVWQARAAARERDTARRAEAEQARLRHESDRLAASESALRAQAEDSEQRAKDQAAEAQRQRDAAEASRKQAELIADFMSEMLEGAEPRVALGRDITMLKEMVDAAAARIEKGDLKGAPEAELRLRGTIGNVYSGLGQLDAAARMIEPCVELARSLHSGDHVNVADSLRDLAQFRHVQGRAAEAEALHVLALEMNRRLFPGDDARVAGNLNDLAGARKSLGRAGAAETLLVQASEMYQRLFPGDHECVANSLNNLASARLSLGRAAEAEPLFVQALEMRRRLFPGDHPAVANSLNSLGAVRLTLGKTAEADELFVQGLEMLQRLVPGDHQAVAYGLNNVAGVRKRLGRAAEAEPLFRQALEMRRRLFKGDHPAVASSLVNWAACLSELGRQREALAAAQDGAEMAARVLPARHPDRVMYAATLALIRLKAVAEGKNDQGKQ